MVFAREAGFATILVSITLWVQCAGMAVLIRLARAYIARSKNGLSSWRAGILIVRFSAAMIVLHILQILLLEQTRQVVGDPIGLRAKVFPRPTVRLSKQTKETEQCRATALIGQIGIR